MELNFRTMKEAGESCELAEQFGLTLCPRCARAFTSGGLCGKCEEIAKITMQRIYVGIYEAEVRRRRNKFIALGVSVLFWGCFGVAVAWWVAR